MAAPTFNHFDQLTVEDAQASIYQQTLFLERISALKKTGAKFVYRGESRERLFAKYDCLPKEYLRPFVDRFYLIGDKGRNFLNDIEANLTTGRTRYGIAEATDSVFEQIFTMTARLLNSDEAGVQQFKRENPSFAEFFANEANCSLFVLAVSLLGEQQRIMARDYYLTLLHSHSSSDYYPISSYLSTSARLWVAEDFQGAGNDINDKIVIYSWLPFFKNGKRHTVTFDYLNEYYETLLELDLPVYYTRFFHQEEVTLKGGMLPHFILGFSYFESGVPMFNINPYLLENVIHEKWFFTGLTIDQTDFWHVLRRTSYLGGFYVNEEGVYGQRSLI